jgi:hypothetical protein
VEDSLRLLESKEGDTCTPGKADHDTFQMCLMGRSINKKDTDCGAKLSDSQRTHSPKVRVPINRRFAAIYDVMTRG